MRTPPRRFATALLLTWAILRIAGCGTSPMAPTPLAAPSGTNSSASASNVASGPVLGYWWDTTASGLRPTYGIPGAAHLGQASFNDGSFSGATACSQKGFALLTNKSGALFLAKLPSEQPVEVS